MTSLRNNVNFQNYDSVFLSFLFCSEVIFVFLPGLPISKRWEDKILTKMITINLQQKWTKAKQKMFKWK